MEHGEDAMDLNLNLSPPPTPHLRLALGLGVGVGVGVGPASPAPVNDDQQDQGSIPRRVWPRHSQLDPHRGAAFCNDEPQAVGRYRSRQARHRWRVLEGSPSSESLSPFVAHTHTPFQQTNPRTIQDALDNDSTASNFECNICLEMARDPVVTSCGHLFCWACLYQWLHVHSASKECPVCKGEVTDPNITPIYGRGNSDHAGTESNMLETGDKIPPRPRANRIESWRQRRPISRRVMEAIRLTRRRDDSRVQGAATQHEPSTTPPRAAPHQILDSFSVHSQAPHLQRARSAEDRWYPRQVVGRRSLVRPNAHSPPEGEWERESIWGHLAFGRLPRSERAGSETLASIRERLTAMEGMLNSGNSDINSNANDQGLQERVRSGVSDPHREMASISSTNAMILTESRAGDAVAEQDSGISSSFQRRRHVPSCSDSDGGLLNVRKRRRLN